MAARSSKAGRKIVRKKIETGKRSLKAFLADEDGFVSRETILKVGFTVAAGAGLAGAMSSDVMAQHTNEYGVTKPLGTTWDESGDYILHQNNCPPATCTLTYDYAGNPLCTHDSTAHTNSGHNDSGHTDGISGGDHTNIGDQPVPPAPAPVNFTTRTCRKNVCHDSGLTHANRCDVDTHMLSGSDCSVQDAIHSNVPTHINSMYY